LTVVHNDNYCNKLLLQPPASPPLLLALIWLTYFSGDKSSLALVPQEPLGIAGARYFLQAGCPSCHPTNSVKALMGKGW